MNKFAASAAALALTGAVFFPGAAQASEQTELLQPAGIEQGVSTSKGGGVALPQGNFTPNYTSHPEGGTWIHGTDNGVYSRYHHPSKRHGSTAMNGRGLPHRVTNIPGGQWANSSIFKTTAGNTAYWHLN